jgi:hypothetical protein
MGYLTKVIQLLLGRQGRDVRLHQLEVSLTVGEVGLDIVEGQLLLVWMGAGVRLVSVAMD